ncbi:MAG: hypothetical protein KDB53_16250 [Planctomycetes bacterium]|nr:hypothetical protein [Planctomycetota bacterium]
MPDPRELRVGDRVRFVSLPTEWESPTYSIQADSVKFMRTLIARNYSQRISEIDEHGFPAICATIRDRKGQVSSHWWLIVETTGWVRVKPRAHS